MKTSFNDLWTRLKNLVGSEANSPKTLADYNREALIRQGREQFKKLVDKGLNVPVALL